MIGGKESGGEREGNDIYVKVAYLSISSKCLYISFNGIFLAPLTVFPSNSPFVLTSMNL